MERMLQWSHIFENYAVGATRLPQTFLNSKKLHFQIFIDPKTVQARMIWIMIRVEGTSGYQAMSEWWF